MRFIVIGAGEVGRLLARDLSGLKQDVVVIDVDPEVLARIEEEIDAMTLLGQGTHRDVLEQAGVSGAEIVFATTPNDATNLVAGALCREMGARHVAARVVDPRFFRTTSPVERGVLGLDVVMCPARLASSQILTRIRRLELPFVANITEFSAQVVMCPIEGGSRMVNEPASSSLPGGAAVRAVVRDGMLRGVEEIQRLDVGDQALIVSPTEGVTAALERMGRVSSIKRLVIVGGGSSGQSLARSYDTKSTQVQLLEIDRARAERLAAGFEHVRVLAADGTHPDVLRDLQIDTAQALASLTHEDELNLTTALLARQLGVPHTFIAVGRTGYTEIFEQLGIDGVVSRPEITARAMGAFFLKALQERHTAIPHSHHAMAELMVPKSGAGRVLADLPLPAQAHVLAHARRGALLEVDPKRSLEEGDALVFAALPRLLKNLVRLVAGQG